MESQDATVLRASPLREDGYRIASFIETAQPLHMLFDAITHRIILCLMNHHTIERIIPHPVVGEEDDSWRQHHQTHQVEMRLMVADQDGRLLKVLTHTIIKSELHTWHMMNHETGDALQQTVVFHLPFFRRLAQMEVKPRIRQQEAIHHHEKERQREE